MRCRKSLIGLVSLVGLVGAGCTSLPPLQCGETRTTKALVATTGTQIALVTTIKQEVECNDQVSYTIRYTRSNPDER